MCLGLLVSALVSTSEKAMPFLVLLTMIQVILSGGVPVSLPFGLTATPPTRGVRRAPRTTPHPG